jgi:hypothetical protein
MSGERTGHALAWPISAEFDVRSRQESDVVMACKAARISPPKGFPDANFRGPLIYTYISRG